MVVIRLSRGGSHKRPFYQVVAADQRCACQGKYLERLGFFNPVAAGAAERLGLNLERVEHWLSVGAQPSERVASLIKELKNRDWAEHRQAKRRAMFERQAARRAAEKSEKSE